MYSEVNTMSSNLSYALTRIQFGQITESTFTKNSDVLIEALGAEYPIFVSKKIEQTEIRFDSSTLEQSVIKTQVPMITLLSADEEWGVRVTLDHIILHTYNYLSYENFEERVAFILAQIQELMGIRHLAFTGLRYLNKFDETNFSQNFKRKEFLQPTFEKFGMAGSNLASRYVDGKFGININSGVIVNNKKYPQDITELLGDLKVENPVMKGAWAHLDLDIHSREPKLIPYSHENVMSTLGELRARAKIIYNSIIKDSN